MATNIQCKNCGVIFTPKNYSKAIYCSMRCRSEDKSKDVHPNLKTDYFALIDTKDKAYWLGFLYADGAMIRQANGSLRFSLNLSPKDEDQLNRFITSVGANPTKKYRYKEKYVSIVVGHQKFCECLVQQGCVPKKTLGIRYPHFVSMELDKAFLLGVFDGDGCIGDAATSSPVIASGSRAFLQDIKERYHLSFALREYHKPIKESASLHISCILSIGKSLYIQLLDNYEHSMPRKRDRGTQQGWRIHRERQRNSFIAGDITTTPAVI